MKKFLITLLSLVALAGTLAAQNPKGFNYQMVVRDNAGRLVNNKNVSVRLSIVQGSQTGTTVYTLEKTDYTTNANGLVTMVVGAGSAQYAAIDWSNGPYFIKSEVDPDGNANYTLQTFQQILSVPYAEHASVADSVSGAATFPEHDPIFVSWGYKYDSLVGAPTNLSQFNNDPHFITANDLLLTISGDTLCINGVSCVVLPRTTSIPWDSVTGHPDSLSQFVNDLTISYSGDTLNIGGTTIVMPHVALYWDSIIDHPERLSQFINDLTLSFSGDTLYVGGNSVVINIEWDSILNHPTYLSQFINDITIEWDSVVNRPDSLSQFVNNITIEWDSVTNRPDSLSQFVNNITIHWDSIIGRPDSLSQFVNDLPPSFTETQNLYDVLLRGNDAQGLTITGLGNPHDDSNATNKHYVDSLFNYLADSLDNLAATVAGLGNDFDSIMDNLNDSLTIINNNIVNNLGDSISNLNALIDSLRTLIDSIRNAHQSEIDSLVTIVSEEKHQYIDGELTGIFSVSANKKVRFSKGNLQYRPSTKTWRFARNQYTKAGPINNLPPSLSDYSEWIDLFGYGASGWMVYLQPYHFLSTSSYPSTDLINDEKTTPEIIAANFDWGYYNPIINGGNQMGLWRTLTNDEWNYILSIRPNAANLRSLATVEGIAGLIILPDDWSLPFNPVETSFITNSFTSDEWKPLHDAGAVFLPAGGYSTDGEVATGTDNSVGQYWSSSTAGSTNSYSVLFSSPVGVNRVSTIKSRGCSVRVVRDYNE